jgi:hypothetical protein
LKVKKESLIVSILVLSFCFGNINIQGTTNQTEVKISYVLYHPYAEHGELLTVEPHFKYENSVYIRDSYIYLHYTINSDPDIPAAANYVKSPTGSSCARPESVLMTIPSSSIMPKDVIRFEIRWTWSYNCFSIPVSAVSQIYTINIQDVPEDTAAEDGPLGIDTASIITTLIALGSITFVILFQKKKNRGKLT